MACPIRSAPSVLVWPQLARRKGVLGSVKTARLGGKVALAQFT